MMRIVARRFAPVALAALWGVAATCQTLAADETDQKAFSPHPAAAALEQVFDSANQRKDFTASGISRRDYLSLIAGDVDFFKKCQNSDGAIIDPYIKQEVQYSTPAFAVAAGILSAESGRADLLEPAERALSCSITALVTHHAANGHSDFYIPLIVHAFRLLKDKAPASLVRHWHDQLSNLDPTTAYNAQLRLMNWNIVSSCGELLRRHDGLIAPDLMAKQADYLEKCLAGHIDKLTRFGMYEDPSSPLAYDQFARLWLDDMMADDAYSGPLASHLREFLRMGGLSTLLLLSPSGEWASGGRSALHNWNEAETAVICEINANYWKQAGRPDVAGAFKRGAHLAFESMRRWQRPSGELWIIKNRAEPPVRLGYEIYSFHTQYNLLPMAMLAMAYEHADDSIAERPAPAEVGGYVFDLRQIFHKIVAAAGGYYILIDTSADPHYNATGLQRVHRSGVAFPPLNDSSAPQRAYGPTGGDKMALAPGIQWKTADQANSPWRSLADFTLGETDRVSSVALEVGHTSSDEVAFKLDFALDGPTDQGRHIVDNYVISGAGVECDDQIVGGPPIAATRVGFPALVSDGAEDTGVTTDVSEAKIVDHGSVLDWRIITSNGKNPAAELKLVGPRLVTHSGYVRDLVADLPAGETQDNAHWRITLSQQGNP